MRTTEPKKIYGAHKITGRIKRYALLALIIAAAAIAFNRMSASAQDGQQESKITRDDCSYLQNPDSFRDAMARHRDLVSRSTEIISQSLISALDERPKSPWYRRRTSREKFH